MPHSRLRKTPKRPPLTVYQILSWADDWFAAHSRWPNVNSGRIPSTIDDTWRRIDHSLRQSYRGLPEKPRLSLAKLLTKRRGVRNGRMLHRHYRDDAGSNRIFGAGVRFISARSRPRGWTH